MAGSEKVDPGNTPLARIGQAKAVNTSLAALGMVIAALADKKSFVPYRASILTRILKESLGGNSKTVLVITCSPSPLNVEETLSSLRFAARVKSVKNHPVVNREPSLTEVKTEFLIKLGDLKAYNNKRTKNKH